MGDYKKLNKNSVQSVDLNDFSFNMNKSLKNATTTITTRIQTDRDVGRATKNNTNNNGIDTTAPFSTNHTETLRDKRYCSVPTNRVIIAIIVYISLLLDNVLLTTIVPILPDYLASLDDRILRPRFDLGKDTANFGLGTPANNVAYRSMKSNAHSLPPILTKRTIPKRSMANFSVTPNSFDGDKISASVLNDGDKYNNGKKNKNNNNNNKALQRMQQRGQSQLGRGGAASEGIERNTEKYKIQNISGSVTEDLTNENGSVGFLLAMKALIQLIFNPIVGNLSTKVGYRLPIIFGTFCLLASSLGFAIGDSYTTLLIARSVQGIGSACIGVCGMSLVAEHYLEEERRCKVMGIILGSTALGVLVGYPLGGILYDLVSKPAPFMLLSAVIFINLGLQLFSMDLSFRTEVPYAACKTSRTASVAKWRSLIENKMVLAIVLAIWFSTSTMAVLEPCLPIWLMQNLNPYKWQLGTVFIPDSIGYLMGTSLFGTIAYKNGQVKIACISLLLVGISSILVPNVATVWQLLMPHFMLGLGIGIIDASLVPLLATHVDNSLIDESVEDIDIENNVSSISSYGTVYAFQQTSVSLAYFLAPLLGGRLAESIGFAWLMRTIGFINLAYAPAFIVFYNNYYPRAIIEKRNQMLISSTGKYYKKSYNSVNVD